MGMLRKDQSLFTALAGALLLVVVVGVGAGCGASAPQPAPRATVTVTVAPSPPATAPPSSPSASPSPDTPPPFRASVSLLSQSRRQTMIDSGSWSADCPVSLDDLRLVSLTYWGFDGRPHTGRLIVNQDAVTAIVGALHRLYDARFPIRRMVLVDAYGANDERSMEADNTSAFNGRLVEGSSVWSEHALGRAIDIDPLENPMVKDGAVFPHTAGKFVDRNLGLPGMITANDVVERAFAAYGWGWGGDWHSLKDYQHFSASGR